MDTEGEGISERDAIAELWPHRNEGGIRGIIARNALREIVRQAKRNQPRRPPRRRDPSSQAIPAAAFWPDWIDRPGYYPRKK